MKKKEKSVNPLKILILCAAGILAGFFVCRIFFFSYTVQDSAMDPAVPEGTRILMFRFGTPAPGDLTLAEHPYDEGCLLLRRAAAGPDTRVEIRNKILYLDGKKAEALLQGYSSDPRNLPMSFTYRDSMPAVKTGSSSFFLLGDNRDRSWDSRDFGPVEKDRIKGTVLHIFK